MLKKPDSISKLVNMAQTNHGAWRLFVENVFETVSRPMSTLDNPDSPVPALAFLCMKVIMGGLAEENVMTRIVALYSTLNDDEDLRTCFHFVLSKGLLRDPEFFLELTEMEFEVGETQLSLWMLFVDNGL